MKLLRFIWIALQVLFWFLLITGIIILLGLGVSFTAKIISSLAMTIVNIDSKIDKLENQTADAVDKGVEKVEEGKEAVEDTRKATDDAFFSTTSGWLAKAIGFFD